MDSLFCMNFARETLSPGSILCDWLAICSLSPPFQSFRRLVLEVLFEEGYRGRLRPDTVIALQRATETYVRSILEDSNKCAVHAKRNTLSKADVLLAHGLSGHPGIIV